MELEELIIFILFSSRTLKSIRYVSTYLLFSFTLSQMFHWPLKVEIHRSTVSTDGFHSKCIIQSKILNNYFIFTVSQMFCVQLKKKMGRISICKFTWIGRQRRKICAKVWFQVLLVKLILQPCYEVSLENFLSLLVIAI